MSIGKFFEKTDRTEKTIRFFFFVVLSFGYTFFCSLSTSPLFPHYVGADTGMFLTIQKCWAQGAIPYRDLFDHKGPWSFFVGMLGFLLHPDSAIGVFVMQNIFMIATLYSFYAIIGMATENTKIRYGVVAASLVVLSLTYEGGNMVEEYTLPFIGFTLYGFLRYFRKLETDQNGGSEATEHPFGWTIFYGISFATCFLTRLTNGMAIASGILVIIVVLVRHKLWKNLFENALAFICGFLLLFGPFAIYFASKGVFNDFWYGTIGFNFDFVESTTPWIFNKLTLHNVWLYLTRYFPAHGMLLAGILAFMKKKKERGWFYIIVAVVESYMFLTSKLFFHYVMIAIPQFTIIFMEIIGMSNARKMKLVKRLLLAAIIVYSLLSIESYAKSFMKTYRETLTYENGYDELMQALPEEGKESFIAYQVDRYIYYHYDIIPYYRYFVLQENHSNYSVKTAEAVHQIFDEGDVEWILTGTQISRIEEILNSDYELYEQTQDGAYSLYRRK